MRHDPNAILCENCGYDLTGLPEDEGAKCPECGKPAAESLPERRVGSAWQRRPTASAFWATARQTIMQPRQRWDEVEIEFGRSGDLQFFSIGLSSILWGLLWIAASWPFFSQATDIRSIIFRFCLVGALVVVCMFPLLGVLSMIEARGIQLFAKRRGWRTTRAVARAVVGHASVGWLLGPAFGFAALLLLRVVEHLQGRNTPDAKLESMMGYKVFLVGQFVIPLLVFEVLVYLGWRRMRFANRPRRPERARPPSPRLD